MIDRCFAFDMVDEILAALAADGSDFAAATRDILLTKSPSSLVLTLCLLRLGRGAPSLEACLEREFHASLAVLDEGDFREGIRAAVIDKDKTPRWNRRASTRSIRPGSPLAGEAGGAGLSRIAHWGGVMRLRLHPLIPSS